MNISDLGKEITEKYSESEINEKYERAILSEGKSMKDEDPIIRESWNFWWSLLERDKRIYIEFAPREFRDNEEFVIKALRDEADNIQFATSRLQNDPDVCYAVLYENNNLLTGFEGETIRGDYDFMIKVIRDYNWENIKYATSKLTNNADFMRSAIRVSSKAKAFIGYELSKNESFMKEIENY